ncbi:Rab family GTPase [Reinekea marina]|nr:Rab family GTPase [Reinekea marina]MDN3649858.1 Rab family GTPase [Reinekea marina]
MVGSFAVGKTSLVKRFVESIYSEKYQTTIGVKISKKSITINDQLIKLLIWDIEGDDVFTELKANYLRGSSGILLVVDGTRPKSYDNLQRLMSPIQRVLGEVPIVLIANKVDLIQEWKMDDSFLADMAEKNMGTFVTSAKDGTNVDAAFQDLAEKMMYFDTHQGRP